MQYFTRCPNLEKSLENAIKNVFICSSRFFADIEKYKYVWLNSEFSVLSLMEIYFVNFRSSAH